MAEDGGNAVDVVPDATFTPLPTWLQRIMLLLPLLGLLGILGLNFQFWYRFATYKSSFDHMDEGQCRLNSPNFSTPWLTWKKYQCYPVLGTISRDHTCWTKVPCDVNVTSTDSQGNVVHNASESTRLLFTYWQGWVPNFITDTCSHLVPKLANRSFDCTFDFKQAVSHDIYDGRKEDIPNYPFLFSMKAAGLTTCTLAPLLVLACCCFKGHLKRARRQAAAREALGGGQSGIGSDCGSGTSSGVYAPLLQGT